LLDGPVTVGRLTDDLISVGGEAALDHHSHDAGCVNDQNSAAHCSSPFPKTAQR
jgi:hypothetical protein